MAARGQFRPPRRRARMVSDARLGGELSAVREVLNRTMALGVVAVLGAVLVMATLRASAQAGGVMGGHGIFNHGDSHPFIGQPLVRPGQAPPVVVNRAPAVVNRAFGFELLRHQHRFFRPGLPVAGFGLSFGPFEAPIADAGSIARPLALPAVDDGSPVPVAGGRIFLSRGDCRSETRIVPSEDGGARPITITWCRKG
jgi:hypothetical protein